MAPSAEEFLSMPADQSVIYISRRSRSGSRSRERRGRSAHSGGRKRNQSSGKSDNDGDTRRSSAATRPTRATQSTSTRSAHSSARSKASSSRRSIDPHGQKVDNTVNPDGNHHDDFAYSNRYKKMSQIDMELNKEMGEKEIYASMARRKASLMTNHDFEQRSNEKFRDDVVDGCSEGRRNRRRESHSSTTKTIRTKTRSKSRSRTSKCHDDTKRSKSSCRSHRSTSKSRRSSTHRSTSRSRRSSHRSTSRSRRSRTSSHQKLKAHHTTNNVRSSSNSSPQNGEGLDKEYTPVTTSQHKHHETQVDIPPDMTGLSIGEANHTTVSSMSSTDSFIKKYIHLRQMKRKEFEERRQLRMEQKKKAELEGYSHLEDGVDEMETLYRDEDDCEDSFFPSSFYSRGISRHSPTIYTPLPADNISTHSRNSRRSSQVSSIVARRSSQTSVNSFYHDPNDFLRSTNTLASPPVYQREKCCIKHPHILLYEQKFVNEWTCMRYCKDHESGRWQTVKMVCVECLNDEQGDCEDPGFEDMTFYSETEEDEISHHSATDDPYYRERKYHRETVNVLPVGDDTPLEREVEAQKRRFIRRLAARAYHFPGNSWCEDFIQYTSNTHLVFGIFLHHPLHPVTRRARWFILLGSVAIGLLMSNLIYLWFVHAGFGRDDVVVSFGSLNVTKLMVMLWTLGSISHTVFDLSIWHIKACTLCRLLHTNNYVSDRAVRWGRVVGVLIVLFTLALASYLVLLRASEDYKVSLAATIDEVEVEEAVNGESSFIQPMAFGGARYYNFLVGYIVEFILAVFVYNPLIVTVIFTGMLGCNGRIPILGGRPREVMREQRYAMKRQRYTMPQTLKLGDQEYEADTWGPKNQKLATNF